jgi:hypothetical protein
MTPEEIAADLELQASKLEDQQKSWPAGYAQIEDMGASSARIRELREQARRIRAAART